MCRRALPLLSPSGVNRKLFLFSLPSRLVCRLPFPLIPLFFRFFRPPFCPEPSRNKVPRKVIVPFPVSSVVLCPSLVSFCAFFRHLPLFSFCPVPSFLPFFGIALMSLFTQTDGLLCNGLPPQLSWIVRRFCFFFVFFFCFFFFLLPSFFPPLLLFR